MKTFAYIGLIVILAATAVAQEQENVTAALYFSHTGIAPGQTAQLAIELRVASGWHIYAADESMSLPTQVEVKPCAGLTFRAPIYPAGHSMSSMGQQSSVYEGKVLIYVPVEATPQAEPGKRQVTVLVNYQACDDKLCMMGDKRLQADWQVLKPQERAVATHTGLFPEKPLPRQPAATPSAPKPSPQGASERGAAVPQGLLALFIAAFIGGILTSLTPCVYPMIPITVGYFAKQAEDKSKRQIFILSLIFVLGIVCLYAGIGALVLYSNALFGKQLSFNFLLQTPLIVWILVAVFWALGLSMFGLYEFRLPGFITSRTHVSGGGVWGAFFRGFFLGIVAAPCMGPALVAILTFALTLSPFIGVLLLAVYALGVGVLFILLALFSGMLPRGGNWMHGIEIAMGVLIFLLGLYFFWMVVSLSILAVVSGALLLLFTLYLLWEPIREKRKSGIRFAVAFLSLLAGLFFTAGFLLDIEERPAPIWALEKALYPGDWIKDYDAGMALARKENRPVLVDVWAKWCVPCIVMDHTTFKDPRIQETLSSFVAVKLDITTLDEQKKAFMERHNLTGPPSFVIFDAAGKVFKIYPYKVDTEVLLNTLQAVLQQAPSAKRKQSSPPK